MAQPHTHTFVRIVNSLEAFSHKAALPPTGFPFAAWLNPVLPMSRAIILAHHDRDSLIDPHVVQALRRYRQVADRLVVVSTSAEALPVALADCVDTFFSRPNVGYDFCSWQAGLAALGDPGAFAEVILVNDSMYGPLADLAPVLADPRVAEADLWGMVLSDQATRQRGKRVCPHLQSWFLAARRPLLNSEVWRRFWERVEPLPSKEAIIDSYEIGLTEEVAAAGFPIAGLYNGSSATHAGGGVCGIPGWQAAKAALADKKKGLKRFRSA